MNHDHWKQLSRRVDSIIAQQRGQLARIASTEEKGLIGQLLRFDLAMEVEPDWLVVGIAPQPDQYVIVPTDDYPLLRPSDVVLGLDHPNGPLTVRCGSSITLPREFLEMGRCVDMVGEDVVQRVRDAIEQSQQPNDDEVFELDPDEEDWLETIRAASGSLSELPNAKRTVQLSEFQKNHEFLRGAARISASGNEVASYTPTQPDPASLAVDIPVTVGGRLCAVLEDQQIRFWYASAEEASPPELIVNSLKSESNVEWLQAPTEMGGSTLFYSRHSYAADHGMLDVSPVKNRMARYQIVLPENHGSAKDH